MKKIAICLSILFCFKSFAQNDEKKKLKVDNISVHENFIKDIWEKEVLDHYGYVVDIKLKNLQDKMFIFKFKCEKMKVYGVLLPDLNLEIKGVTKEDEKIDVQAQFNGGSSGGHFLFYGVDGNKIKKFHQGQYRTVYKAKTKKDCETIPLGVHPALNDGEGYLIYNNGLYEFSETETKKTANVKKKK